MFGLSTVWKSKVCENGKQLIEEILAAEIPGIELEYRITVEMFQQMKPALKESGLTVLSVHNYFPHPEILPREKASGDALFLSATDPDERKLAVKYARRTIQYAHELEAQAVVFHLGKVNIKKERSKWLQLYDENKINTSEGKEFIAQKTKQRQAQSAKSLDAVLFSLDQLNEEAIRRNVLLGIENRYYFNEIPNVEEIGIILQKFAGGNIGYWHDCGHAQTWESLGIAKHEDFLQAYSNNLIGIHLHDCNGYNDHIAPGQGTIDFEMIKKYLTPQTIKIIEVHNRVTLSELKEGVAFLKDKRIL